MKKLLPIIKPVFAVVIIMFLLHKINSNIWLYNFIIEDSEPSLYTTYEYEETPFVPYSTSSNLFQAFCYSANVDLPKSGTLIPADSKYAELTWSSFSYKKHGLKALKLSITKAYDNKLMFFLTIGLFAICLTSIIVRWKIILEGLKIAVTWLETIRIFLIGQFFNFFMIGATGGDIVKAIYIAGRTDKKTESASSVFIDRFIGLFAQVSLTSIILMINIKFYMQFSTTKYISFFIITAFAVFILIILSIIFAKPLIDWFIDKLPGKHKFISIIDTVYEAARFCLTNKNVAFKTLILSYINHITAIVMMLTAGLALGVDLPWQTYFLITPVINTIGSIPITPGGLGMREMAAVNLFGLLGVNMSSAFFLSFITYFAGMLWAIPGAVIYLSNNRKNGKK